VRVLFSCTSGEGHLNPLLPLAHALQVQSHEVAFAMADSYAARLQRLGFRWFAAGIGPEELNRRTWSVVGESPSPPSDPEIFVARFAAGDAPDRAAGLRGVIAEWRPDRVVFEPCDLAAPVAAAAAGVPAVLHSFGRALPRGHYDAAAPVVAPLWRSAGLPLPPACGVYDGAYVDICPQRLRGETLPDGTYVLQLRPTQPPTPEEPPEWLQSLPNRPTVYITLGTLFNDIERFRVLLEAMDALDCNVVATIGRDNDPAELGPSRPGVVIEQYIPQSLLLPQVDVMVGHGGSGSMLAGLAHGIPQLLLPAGADQHFNAHACQLAGAARVLTGDQLQAAAARDAVRALLVDQTYRANARAIADEIARMPDPDRVAAAITR
jgi:UDP:flavonoid glycosyltransferase YjiC (YdhE family)